MYYIIIFEFSCFIIGCYFMLCMMICGSGLTNFLDKETRYTYDEYKISNKYDLIIIFCNIFCLLFIKHHRKINFYKKYIKNCESCCSYMYKDDTKYILYKRLLKLEKIK